MCARFEDCPSGLCDSWQVFLKVVADISSPFTWRGNDVGQSEEARRVKFSARRDRGRSSLGGAFRSLCGMKDLKMLRSELGYLSDLIRRLYHHCMERIPEAASDSSS